MRIAAVVLLLFLASCAETISKKSESYSAGYKTIHTVDKSRNYKQNTDTADYLHYRPIDIDMWYPADSSAADTVLLVRDLLGLLEHRANYYAASAVGDGITAQLAQYFSEGFKCSDSATLLRFKTTSLKNADAVKGKFPLVVYMTAYNGMSYENFTLFEALAKKGFVVLSISSIGRFPGDMTMKKEDLMEQVNDAVAALDLLKQNQHIDFNNIGIVGYSWGGLAGAVLASKISNAKCLVSLEGSEFHHYGNAKSEDADFDSIINSKDFEDVHLSIPYLRLESGPTVQPDKKDSVYDFAAYHTTNAQVFSIDSAQHQDFGCFSVIVKESGNCAINKSYHSALKLTAGFMQDHLKNDNSFSNTVNQEMNKTIKKK